MGHSQDVSCVSSRTKQSAPLSLSSAAVHSEVPPAAGVEPVTHGSSRDTGHSSTQGRGPRSLGVDTGAGVCVFLCVWQCARAHAWAGTGAGSHDRANAAWMRPSRAGGRHDCKCVARTRARPASLALSALPVRARRCPPAPARTMWLRRAPRSAFVEMDVDNSGLVNTADVVRGLLLGGLVRDMRMQVCTRCSACHRSRTGPMSPSALRSVFLIGRRPSSCAGSMRTGTGCLTWASG